MLYFNVIIYINVSRKSPTTLNILPIGCVALMQHVVIQSTVKYHCMNHITIIDSVFSCLLGLGWSYVLSKSLSSWQFLSFPQKYNCYLKGSDLKPLMSSRILENVTRVTDDKLRFFTLSKKLKGG